MLRPITDGRRPALQRKIGSGSRNRIEKISESPIVPRNARRLRMLPLRRPGSDQSEFDLRSSAGCVSVSTQCPSLLCTNRSR